jgi:hypothetical protein
VKSRRVLLSLSALLFATGGCFEYVPEGSVEPARGTTLRLHLENPTSFDLTQFTVNNIIIVNGELVRREAGDVIVSAKWLDAAIGDGFDGENWTLRIPETNVSAVEVKRLSWWRTGAAVLGIAAVTIFGFDAFGTGTEGSGGGGGGTNPL